ncbi:hypothetical protein AB4Z01_33745 [Inquilinus sp. YAF38]|uniref:hypothetical protein n=1 Tax=Inquilinus sp. YAF38 TaxID=3233084 RepID=UPI003F8DA211
MAVLFDGELFADYHQFYLSDAAGNAEMPTDWTDEALRRRILCADGVLVVSTARNMTVPVRIELHDEEPQFDAGLADHIVIGDLRTSGEIVVAGCSDYLPDAARRSVPEGDLRVMIVFTGLGSLSEDGLAGEDRYVVHLWPGRGEGVAVLRQWSAD